MTPKEIQDLVIGVLRDVQAVSGRSWTAIDTDAKPIGSLDGFDSLSAIEATVMVEAKLGGRDLGVESIFISEDGQRALTVSEVAAHVSKLLAANGAKA